MPKSQSTPATLSFYLDGREENRTLAQEGEIELDANDIAKRIRSEPSLIIGKGLSAYLREETLRQVDHLRGGKPKRKWVDDNAKALKKLEVSDDDAYAAYLQGRIDETVYATEESVVDALGD